MSEWVIQLGTWLAGLIILYKPVSCFKAEIDRQKQVDNKKYNNILTNKNN